MGVMGPVAEQTQATALGDVIGLPILLRSWFSHLDVPCVGLPCVVLLHG